MKQIVRSKDLDFYNVSNESLSKIEKIIENDQMFRKDIKMSWETYKDKIEAFQDLFVKTVNSLTINERRALFNYLISISEETLKDIDDDETK